MLLTTNQPDGEDMNAPHNLCIYCADIGSVKRGNFGWSCGTFGNGTLEYRVDIDGTEIQDLTKCVAEDLNAGLSVSLGFECPLFVPIRENPRELTSARKGEGSRAWSAGAGAGALTTGLTEVVWILREIRQQLQTEALAYTDWELFTVANGGLFLWEAFISGKSKGDSHTADAEIGVQCFATALPDPTEHDAIDETSVHSLLGAALLRTGWSQDLGALGMPCLVLKA